MKENFEKIEKPKEEIEKRLNSKKIEQLGEGMVKHFADLEVTIKRLKTEQESFLDFKDAILLEELKEQHEMLKDFIEDIESNNYEEITEKPVE